MPVPVEFSPDILNSHLLVDVRSPGEYAEDHIPGALNVPLLTNEERVEIGTLYKQTGPQEARIRALELTAGRFPAMARTITAAAGNRPILVYCWRGGLRSKTVVAILNMTGYDACQLKGGYKSFRNQVIAFFNPFRPVGPMVVLHGMTGVGKTAFLLGLNSSDYSVVDLEGLACHRGSAFGELGLSQSLSQKRFETLLWDVFRKAYPGKPIIIEGESQRIGRMTLPGNLYETMGEGCKIWCEASLPIRIRRLMDEYGLPGYQEGMAAALLRIKNKLGNDNYEEISGHLQRWELEPFMAGLIRHYYDKFYYRTRKWQEEYTLSLDDYETATGELTEFLHQHFG